MIVDPYVRSPAAPTVAVLTREGRIVSEHGELLDPDDWPKDTRAWCDYDTVRELVTEQGIGEALCWNSEEIRWRHERLDVEGWKARRSDVSVLRLPFPEEPTKALQALGAWRDWLARYGASPTGTSGSAAWSLLRATLTETLYCSMGSTPPILQTLGGRVELGPAGAGRYEGALTQVDMQAAYARELSSLRYGGRWYRSGDLPGVRRSPDWWASEGRPVFVRARLQIPDGLYGPLVRRPLRRTSTMLFFFSQLHERRYPVATTMQGVWTWQEVSAAVEHGARLLGVLEFWVHMAARRPFADWWTAIEQGRSMPGLAGQLAKVTGNALWGRFCMDARTQGRRSIRSRNGKISSRELPLKGGLPPAHDLAETVSGRVRAELYRLMIKVGDGLLSAHTDGAWIRGGEARSESELSTSELCVTGAAWRVKQPARRLDLIDPQTLRYWPSPSHPSEPWHVYAGVPARQAAAAFENAWSKVPSTTEGTES